MLLAGPISHTSTQYIDFVDFYISMDLSTNYFAHFSRYSAFFVCSCHSILECCFMFSGVKLSIRSFVLLLPNRNKPNCLKSSLLFLMCDYTYIVILKRIVSSDY